MGVDRGVPRWLRGSFSIWFGTWFASYLAYFGPQFMLWFCCLANLYLLVGLWTRRALWFSLAAVSTLIVQGLYAADFAWLLASGESPWGASGYMADGQRPLWLRALSAFHLWVPLLTLYGLRRFGYDRRAFLIQTLVCWAILPICYLGFDPRVDTNDLVRPLVDGSPFDRDFNLNWAHGLRDHPVAPGQGPRHFWLLMVAIPVALHLPMHLLLSWLAWQRTKRTARRTTPSQAGGTAQGPVEEPPSKAF